MARQDKTGADRIRAEMDWKLSVYRTAHPVFTEELQSDDGRTRRAKVLNEMRNMINDPQHPDTPHFAALAQATKVFDSYKIRLATLQNDASASGRREVDHLKQQYEGFMNQYVLENPAIQTYWSSVLRPESSLA